MQVPVSNHSCYRAAYYHQSWKWRGVFVIKENHSILILMIKIMWCSTQVQLYIRYFVLLAKRVSPDWNYVAVQLKKTSLTSLPNSSIERVIFSVARRGGGGRLTISSKIGLWWEGEKHGGVSQWETEMIKRLSLLTEKRGLVSIAPSSFHGLV